MRVYETRYVTRYGFTSSGCVAPHTRTLSGEKTLRDKASNRDAQYDSREIPGAFDIKPLQYAVRSHPIPSRTKHKCLIRNKSRNGSLGGVGGNIVERSGQIYFCIMSWTNSLSAIGGQHVSELSCTRATHSRYAHRRPGRLRGSSRRPRHQ